jgi:hypothetical protein
MRIIAAAEAYSTLGEVADAMRRVFGESFQKESPPCGQRAIFF